MWSNPLHMARLSHGDALGPVPCTRVERRLAQWAGAPSRPAPGARCACPGTLQWCPAGQWHNRVHTQLSLTPELLPPQLASHSAAPALLSGHWLNKERGRRGNKLEVLKNAVRGGLWRFLKRGFLAWVEICIQLPLPAQSLFDDLPGPGQGGGRPGATEGGDTGGERAGPPWGLACLCAEVRSCVFPLCCLPHDGPATFFESPSR
nr:PREDICTED: uncharacterized protein LOC103547551 [Equus przewalskii]